MAQQEIIKFLMENKGKRFNPTQIAEKIGRLPGTVNQSLKGLKTMKIVKYKWVADPVLQGRERRVYWI